MSIAPEKTIKAVDAYFEKLKMKLIPILNGLREKDLWLNGMQLSFYSSDVRSKATC